MVTNKHKVHMLIVLRGYWREARGNSKCYAHVLFFEQSNEHNDVYYIIFFIPYKNERFTSATLSKYWKWDSLQ